MYLQSKSLAGIISGFFPMWLFCREYCKPYINYIHFYKDIFHIMFSVVETFPYTENIHYILLYSNPSYACQDSWKLSALIQAVREQTLEGYAFLACSSFRFIYDEINSLGPCCFSRRLTKKLSMFRISASEIISLSYSFLLEHQDVKFIIFAEGIKDYFHIWACSPINQFPWLSQTHTNITGLYH